MTFAANSENEESVTDSRISGSPFIGIVIVYQMFLDKPVLKINQPPDINRDLVDEEVRAWGYHRIADFAYGSARKCRY